MVPFSVWFGILDHTKLAFPLFPCSFLSSETLTIFLGSLVPEELTEVDQGEFLNRLFRILGQDR